jgi:hypothetical protein
MQKLKELEAKTQAVIDAQNEQEQAYLDAAEELEAAGADAMALGLVAYEAGKFSREQNEKVVAAIPGEVQQ